MVFERVKTLVYNKTKFLMGLTDRTNLSLDVFVNLRKNVIRKEQFTYTFLCYNERLETISKKYFK